MAILTIDEEDKSFTFEKIDVSPYLTVGSGKLPGKDMARLIKKIMKQMDEGRAVEEIAVKSRVEEKLVRRILQIYTTHPGIIKYPFWRVTAANKKAVYVCINGWGGGLPEGDCRAVCMYKRGYWDSVRVCSNRTS